MLTTGLGQAHGSPPREPREAEASAQAGQRTVATPTLSLAPTDCPVCGDVEAEPIAVCEDSENRAMAEGFLALCCSDCGSVYLSPAPADDASNGLVAHAGPSRAGRRLARRARSLDPTQVVALRERRDVAIDPARLGAPHYQLVILDGTLEYSHAPLALLAGLRGTLHPGGQVALILNSLASPSFAVFGGRHWAGYDFPRQRAVYSIEGVRRLAGRVGLEVRSISSVADPGCWVESLRRTLTDWRAPAWLVRRFSRTSVASIAVFAILEGMLQWRGKAGLLVVLLGRAPDAAEARLAAADRNDLAT